MAHIVACCLIVNQLNSPTWLTVPEAAAYLRVSRATLYRLCAARLVPYHTLPGSGRRRFQRDELDAAMTAAPGLDQRSGQR